MNYKVSTQSGFDKVLWTKLADGDTITVSYSPTPYNARVCLARGIQLIGELGVNGERPVLDCANAPMFGAGMLRAGYHRDFFSANAGVLSAAPTGDPMYRGKGYTGPPDVEVRNLEITGAVNGIYSWWADGLEIDNCFIHDNLQGVFTNGQGQTHDLWIHDCEFARNGNPGSYRQHQLYIEALGVVFERNTIHNPIPAFMGSAYKSRSGGEVIRNNRIENGGFCLDLCDPQEAQYIHIDPSFHDTLVEGNTFVQGATGGTYFVHFGDDQISRNQDPNGVYADGTPMRRHPEKSRPHLTMRQNTLDIQKAKMTRFCLFDMRSGDQTADVDGLTVTTKNASLNWVNDRGHLTVKNYSGPRVNNSVRTLLGTVSVT